MANNIFCSIQVYQDKQVGNLDEESCNYGIDWVSKQDVRVFKLIVVENDVFHYNESISQSCNCTKMQNQTREEYVELNQNLTFSDESSL